MKIKNIFDKIKGKEIIIIGDSMVDSYVIGEINRNSPEAPVPIVDIQKEEAKLGGAANVALNIQSLGMKPILCSVIGEDEDGKNFLEICNDNNLDTSGILVDRERKTTNKKRVIVDKKHILRIDNEHTNLLNDEIFDRFLKNIEGLISDDQIIIFQDYDKGVIEKKLINKVKKMGNKLFIAVDPKRRNFFDYEDIDLFKPNLNEILDAYKTEDKSISNINHVSDKLKREKNILPNLAWVKKI